MADVQCCFCGKSIAPAGHDPVIVVVLLEDGGTQELYTHAECLRSRLHPSVPFAP